MKEKFEFPCPSGPEKCEHGGKHEAHLLPIYGNEGLLEKVGDDPVMVLRAREKDGLVLIMAFRLSQATKRDPRDVIDSIIAMSSSLIQAVGKSGGLDVSVVRTQMSVEDGEVDLGPSRN